MGLTLNVGGEAITKAAERSAGSGRFIPSMKWEANETKYLQFITPIDEIPTVLMHPLLVTGIREDGSNMYDTFISRRDDAIDGADGYDGFADKFGEVPKKRSIALAVEVEPIYEQEGTKKVLSGFDVVTRSFTDKEGTEKTVPAVQLVMQSPMTFFSQLVTLNDVKGGIDGMVLAVTRKGKTTDTTYQIADIAPGLASAEIDELLAEVEFDFDAYLEGMADADRQREIVDALPSDFVVNKYTKKRAGSGKPATQSRTRQRVAPEASDEPVVDAEPSDGAPTAVRKRRFSALREEQEAA